MKAMTPSRNATDALDEKPTNPNAARFATAKDSYRLKTAHKQECLAKHTARESCGMTRIRTFYNL